MPSQGCMRRRADLVSAAEHDLVHDPPWHERKQTGNHERAKEKPRHGQAVASHSMATRVPQAQRQHPQHQDRQQVDGAPWAPQADVMDPE